MSEFVLKTRDAGDAFDSQFRSMSALLSLTVQKTENLTGKLYRNKENNKLREQDCLGDSGLIYSGVFASRINSRQPCLSDDHYRKCKKHEGGIRWIQPVHEKWTVNPVDRGK